MRPKTLRVISMMFSLISCFVLVIKHLTSEGLFLRNANLVKSSIVSKIACRRAKDAAALHSINSKNDKPKILDISYATREKKVYPMSMISAAPFTEVRLKATDHVYGRGAPIVIEEYKLIFFTIPKVSCSVFKMLFRRMSGLTDWKTKVKGKKLHDARKNGLKYLFHYNLQTAEQMMTSPNWTRAIFVREPKERMLSAYLNKAVDTMYVFKHCCLPQAIKEKITDCTEKIQTFDGFVEVAKKCRDGHWEPQAKRMDKKFWKYINFWGRFEFLANDTQNLLEKIGGADAWKKYGSLGWGELGNESIYHGSKIWHATDASSKVAHYYNSTKTKMAVERMFRDDYKMFSVAWN